MDDITFLYEKNEQSTEQALMQSQKLMPEVECVAQALASRGYDTPYAALKLPYDEAMLEDVKAVVAEKRRLKPTVLVVIGIGGSNLGAKAVLQAVQGSFFNDDSPLKVYWADTVDPDYIYDIMMHVEQALRRDENVLLNVISKSGTTTETIANFELFLHAIKAAHPDSYHHEVVVTTDEGSALWQRAEKEGFAQLAIPKNVGGRYSVLSPVGLFPLAFLGIKIDNLIAGAASMNERCSSIDMQKNSAALSALLIKEHYDHGIRIHDTFLFSVDMQGIGQWYRQLLGESIGKMHNRAGEVVRVGIEPIVSIGTTDLHSVGQLYLGGPRNRFTTFITVQTYKVAIHIPLSAPAPVGGSSLAAIMDAILKGVQAAYRQQELPYVTIALPEKTPYCIGQLLQLKMFEMVYLGFLLDINPFDQPQVELYKKETRKILSDA